MNECLRLLFLFSIIVQDIREAFLEEIRLTGIQDLFPAIRSKLFASLKGFPLLSGVFLDSAIQASQRCATVTPFIYWNREQIYVTFRNYWAAAEARQQRSKHTSESETFNKIHGHLTICK